MKKSISTLAIVAGLVLAVLMFNSLSKRYLGRFYADLTQDRLYSLSAGSKSILSELTEPLTLKFYYSKTDGAKYPAINIYGSRILDLLREYGRASNGKLNVEVYDPRPDSEEEEWAQKYGLTSLPTRNGEQLLLGLVAVNSRGDEQTIPFFDFRRQEFLEYDVTRMIYSLMSAKKPVVGVLSSLDLSPSAPPRGQPEQEQGGAWFFLSQLSQLADVKQLKADTTSIAPEIMTMIVIHPKNLGEQTLYALDQFVMRGGRLLVLEDPFCQADQPKQDPSNPMAGMMADHSSSLNSLLAKWGVELIDKKAVGDLSLAARVNAGGSEEPKLFLLWPALQKENVSANDVVSSALENVLLPWPGALKISPVEGVQVETLLSSSNQAALIDENNYRFNGGDPDALLRSFTPDGKTYPLAVRIRGKLKSNFPNGKPGETSTGVNHLAETKENANLIVIADVDFLSDRFSVSAQNMFGAKLVTMINDNQSLFANAAENLFGSDDLISIRTRGQFSREFTRVHAMEADAQQNWALEEMRLQSELNNANQRLTQLQGGQQGEKQVFNKAMLEEIKKFREQRAQAQERLREVRRNLRQGIERLGELLFLLNTFAVPLLLIIGAVVFYATRGKRRVEIESKN